jgi:hypothetical protein
MLLPQADDERPFAVEYLLGGMPLDEVSRFAEGDAFGLSKQLVLPRVNLPTEGRQRVGTDSRMP